jgi:hypothetical protein
MSNTIPAGNVLLVGARVKRYYSSGGPFADDPERSEYVVRARLRLRDQWTLQRLCEAFDVSQGGEVVRRRGY